VVPTADNLLQRGAELGATACGVRRAARGWRWSGLGCGRSNLGVDLTLPTLMSLACVVADCGIGRAGPDGGVYTAGGTAGDACGCSDGGEGGSGRW
jgi:hypothetical protein